MGIFLLGSPAAGRNFVAEGDSITDVNTAQGSGYSFALSKLANPKLTSYTCRAVSGSGIVSMTARAAGTDACLIPGATNILSVFIGANDLPGTAPSAWLPQVASYCDARRAAGWYVILCTVISRGTGTTETNRIAANAELRLWPVNGSVVAGKHCDAVADFGADPMMGGSGSSNTNTTYFADGIHPTTVGQARLRDIIWPVLDASLSGTRPNPTIRASSYTTEVGSTDLVLNLRADRGVVWSISGGNAGGALNMNELYQLTLNASTLGTYTTTLTATDGNGQSTSQTFTWNVPNPPSGYGPNLIINGNATNGLLGWLQSLNLWFNVDQPNLTTAPDGSGGFEFEIFGDGVAANPQMQQVMTSISGKTYKIDWTMRQGTSSNGATFQTQLGNTTTSNTTNTPFTQSPVASGTVLGAMMVITGAPTGTAFYSNIAVRQLLP